MTYWHVHLDRDPWCLVFHTIHDAKRLMRLQGYGGYIKTLISSDYSGPGCPYWQLMAAPMKGSTMTSPALVRLPDGTDVDGNALTCEGCGNPLAGHSCGAGGAAVSAAPVYVRRTGPRAPVASIPTCAHCGGRIHQNLSGAAVNSECIIRQYALDKGIMSDPFANLPVATIELWEDIVAWAKSLATPITYGKMASAAGGAGTYAGLRPKTGRKKKVAPAAAGAQIQDIADGVTVEEETPAKSKRSRKGKGKVLETPATTINTDDEGNVVTTVEAATEELTEDEQAAFAAIMGTPTVEINGHEAELTPTEDAEQPMDAAAERAERRRRRKELLAAGNA